MRAFAVLSKANNIFPGGNDVIIILEDDGSEDGGKNLAVLPPDLPLGQVAKVAAALGVTHLTADAFE